MPSVTLEVGALVIVFVEWDAQRVVVKVDRPVQVLDFEEDLFDTNESHGLPPPSVQNGELLKLLHRLMPLSFWGLALSLGPPVFPPPLLKAEPSARQSIWTSAPWQNTNLSQEVCVVEIDPGVACFHSLDFHHAAAVKADFASSGLNIAEIAEVRPRRTPTHDHIRVSRQNLLDIQVQVWKRPDVELEEVPRSLMAREWSRKRIGLPSCLLVESLDERLDIVRVPRSKYLTDDLKILLPSHSALLVNRPFLRPTYLDLR